MNPRTIGTIHTMPAEKLAEHALEAMGKKYAYCVAIDRKGVVYVDLPQHVPDDEIIMTCRRTSDPDALTEEIRDETNRRATDLAMRKKA